MPRGSSCGMLLWMKTRLPVLCALGALLVLAAVVARGDSSVPVGQGKPLCGWLRLPSIKFVQDIGARRSGGAPAAGEWATILGWILIFIPIALLVLAIVGAVVLALRQRKIGPPTPVWQPKDVAPGTTEPSAAQLIRAVHKARAVLDEHRGGPPSDAVIAAWVTLEEVAAGNGNQRFAHQTATEFSGVLADRYDGLAERLGRLRNRFPKARVGPPRALGAERAAAR